MRAPEGYWSRKGPHIPEVRDLPAGTFSGGESAWGSLSPGMRREIWRDALRREALDRGLPAETQSRLRIMTISGALGSLDEYLGAIARADDGRPVLKDDADRLARAEATHHQAEVQIAAREVL